MFDFDLINQFTNFVLPNWEKKRANAFTQTLLIYVVKIRIFKQADQSNSLNISQKYNIIFYTQKKID